MATLTTAWPLLALALEVAAALPVHLPTEGDLAAVVARRNRGRLTDHLGTPSELVSSKSRGFRSSFAFQATSIHS